jgi:hypothetical protein
MMTARQTMEEIARPLERALDPDTDLRNARGLLISAHTHAVIQATWLRRAEVRAELAAHCDSGGSCIEP